ncbi:bifunctional 3-(3-hydroxy-phenyl)propionate/3-hydroxycinnamic acid hydroxylase MhpA [Oceanobacillus salinisoli]|uniref:bifunctional 3-(3-hydroxy-phenyl)propionate/3-hydroxycinnamic acid hydroxylase MhpA n=1 Tax=Oceanobacillus salinisoli TaxID=2678611 RepID=UPI0012E1952F|nr:bifunctional 3-(3-hydroxy-phenyl)propionate/3-hydroxycinnamic acid hydroxylase [Oceanobacillus salinisoli]
MKKEYVDVAIIGYGPIAKMLGSLLGNKGWKVGIYEKFVEPYCLPRAVAMDDEIARILQGAVPSDKLEKLFDAAGGEMYNWYNAERELLLSIPFEKEGVSGWPGELFFNQPSLEKEMDQTCSNLSSVMIHYGNEVIDLKEKQESVELTVKEHSGEERKVIAKYTVGCDGANSFVRENMEHTVTDLNFEYDFLVVDLIPKEKSELPVIMQICDPERPTTVVSGGPGRRRWEFMVLPHESKEEVSQEEYIWELLEPWNHTPENSILERSAVYTFKALWVNEWRKGRVMIAGDAAHLTPPFMGQGMCSGIRDAANLAWKLDLVLKGKLNEGILDTFTEERKPHNEKVVSAALYLGEMICVNDPKKAKERDTAFISGKVPPFPAFPILTDGILYQPGEEKKDNLAGQLSFQSKVKYHNKVGLFDDVVGTGWTIISPVQNPRELLNNSQLRFLKDLDATCIEISSVDEDGKGTVVDVTGKYSEYFEENDIEAVIVRPDYYIFGSTSDVSKVSSIVEDLASQLKKYMNTVTVQ